MTSSTIEIIDSFKNPANSRAEFLGVLENRTNPLPVRGSSFFIHLSELCPVACQHCMYSSDLTRKSFKDSLTPEELEEAIAFINASRSEKLNITGGGEPFLKFKSILSLVEKVNVPRIEIVTAGYWAKTQHRAETLMGQIDDARVRNPASPDVMLRLSIDRYHIEAPHPVLIEHYANVVNAWQEIQPGLSLGLRSIEPDRGIVDRQLAEAVDARVVEVNDWNRKLVHPSGAEIPITFNVFRRSGKAAELGLEHDDSTRTIKEYYGAFETGEGRLSLATAVNDAIRGGYPPSSGLAVTLNSDGTFWIFCGTSPDRKLILDGHDFEAAVRYFFGDPITHLLVDEGVWALADLVAALDPPAYEAAIAKNDMASLVDDLLAAADVRWAVTLVAASQLFNQKRLGFRDGDRLNVLISGSRSDLIAKCRTAIDSIRTNR